jgi:hypothetical protein
MSEDDSKARGDFLPDSDAAGDTAGAEAAAKAAAEKEAADKAAAEPKDEAEKKEEPRIPKSRFDEAVKKARAEAEAAMKRADDLESQLKASQGELDLKKVAEEIDVLEEELEKAIADGNVEVKKRLRSEIREKNQQMAEARAAGHAARATATAIEQIRYDALCDRMEREHPELDPQHEDYDQTVVNDILELKEAFEKAGHGSATALDKALKVTFKGAPAPKKKDEKAPDDAEVKAKADAKAKGDAEAAKRTAEAVKRGLEKQDQQPPATKGTDSDKNGKKNTAADIAKMSDKEFDKLSEDDLKRLRGDAA